MRHIAIVAALLAAASAGTLIALPADAIGTTIQPGQYRVTSAIVGQTKPVIRMECYTAEDIAGMFDATMGDGMCTDTRRVIADGKVDIARNCTGKRGTFSGAVTGTYTPTSFTARIVNRGSGMPAPMDIRMVGQRVAATCVAD